MYEELTKVLRNVSEYDSGYAKLMYDAADAIEAQDRHILTLQHEMIAEAESHIALVERLSKQNKKLEEAVKTALDFIPCWIPVTERLPEKSGSYLVYVYGEVTEMDCWHGKWHMLGDDYTKAVTHWMPLPEPPKEE